MIELQAEALRAKFEDFSRRLRARTAEFQQSGEFSDIHQSILRDIQQRHDALAAKLAGAGKSGDRAALVNLELKRDFDGLLDEFALMEERFVADARKTKRK